MTKKIGRVRYFRYGVSAIAGLVTIMGLLAAWQMGNPLSTPAFFPFSETYFARALAAKPPAEAIAMAETSVRVAPGRAENWVLLAYTYQTQDLALSDRVLGALRKSYAVGALSPDAHDWRLQYVFSNWSLMPQDLRRFAMAEAEAYTGRYAGRTFIKDLVPTVSDPNGRLALGMVIVTYQSTKRYEREQAERAAGT
jgi:hypothetical protein